MFAGHEHVDVVEVATPGGACRHPLVLAGDELRQLREGLVGLLKCEEQLHVEPEALGLLDGVDVVGPPFNDRRPPWCWKAASVRSSLWCCWCSWGREGQPCVRGSDLHVEPTESPADRHTLQPFDVPRDVLERWRGVLTEYVRARAALLREIEPQGFAVPAGAPAAATPRRHAVLRTRRTAPPARQAITSVTDTQCRRPILSPACANGSTGSPGNAGMYYCETPVDAVTVPERCDVWLWPRRCRLAEWCNRGYQGRRSRLRLGIGSGCWRSYRWWWRAGARSRRF
jgi:hypothetical protein